MDQPWINHGSTWINVDQASSACPLQHVAAVLTHGSCVMAHVSCVMAHASDSWLMRHGSRVMRHGSCVRLMAHASHVPGVRRQASTCQASCVRLMAHASHSRARRQASTCQASTSHASGVHVPCVRRPIQPIQPPHSAAPFSRRPLSVMTTTQRRHFPMLLLLDLRPLRCMAWGNRVVLPPSYSSMGTNKNSGRRS